MLRLNQKRGESNSKD